MPVSNEKARQRYKTDKAYREKKKAQALKDYHTNLVGRKLTRKKYATKKRYGITLDQYHIMSAAQRNRCAICNEKGLLAIDHCHISGVVRGLLCRPCNSVLGLARDSIKTLIKAILYLGKHKGGYD